MYTKTSNWLPNRWTPVLRILALPILLVSLVGCQSLTEEEKAMKVEEEKGYNETFLRMDMDPRNQANYESQLSEIDLYRSQQCKPFLKTGKSGGSPSSYPGKTIEETKSYWNAIWFKDYPATLKVLFGQREGAYILQIGAHQGSIEILDEVLYKLWYAKKYVNLDEYSIFPFSEASNTIEELRKIQRELEDNAISLCRLPYSVSQEQESEYQKIFTKSLKLYQRYAWLAADYGEYIFNYNQDVENGAWIEPECNLLSRACRERYGLDF